MDKTKGSLAVLLTAIIYGSYGVWALLIKDGFGLFFQTYVRAIIAWLVILIIVFSFGYWKRIRDARDYKIIFYISALGVVSQSIYYAYQNIGIGLASVFSFTSLLLSQYFMGYMFFKEKFGIVNYTSLAMSVLGIYIIFSKDIQGFQVFPVLVAIIAGIGIGLQSGATKLISSYYSGWQISVFSWGLIILTCAPISYLLGEQQKFPSLDASWIYLFLFALVGLTVFPILVYGYKRVDVSVAGLIALLEVPSAIVFGYYFFNESVTTSIIIGSILILSAAMLTDVVTLIKKKYL